MTETIAILGVGSGGCAIAAHLALQGHEVNLCEIPEQADDVPYSLVSYSTVGKKVDVRTPIWDAIINVCSVISRENYWEKGADMEKMFVGS